MSTLRASWLLQSLVGTLMGEPASGFVTATASGAPVLLEPGTVGIPVLGGVLDPERAVLVERNPARDDRAWEVTSSGVPVAVTTVLGGADRDLEAGTPIRWIPPVEGLEELGEIAAPGLAGSTQRLGYGSLRQVRYYQEMTRGNAEHFFAAQLHEYPAAALSWVRMTPADGGSSAALGPRTARTAGRSLLVANEWVLYVVVSRLDGGDERAREGAFLRDQLLGILSGRHAWRGLPLSHPSGLDILTARLSGVTPTSYVEEITFTTLQSATRCEAIGPTDWADWLKTRLQVSLETTPPFPLVDVTDPGPSTP